MKAILTGHTRGLGAAIAQRLLEQNIAVLGLSRKRNAELEKRFPDLLEQEQIDLADSAAVKEWIDHDKLRRFVAGCDKILLINNAGIVQPVGPLPIQDIAVIAQAVGLNIAAPLMLSSAVAAINCNAIDIRIVHISSGAGRSAYPGWSIYCATKAALDHHARAVMLDKIPNVRVCSLAPGVIDTDMQAEIRATPLEQFPLRTRFEDLKREGHLLAPEHCAKQLVSYLLGEQFGQTPVADLRELMN